MALQAQSVSAFQANFLLVATAAAGAAPGHSSPITSFSWQLFAPCSGALFGFVRMGTPDVTANGLRWSEDPGTGFWSEDHLGLLPSVRPVARSLTIRIKWHT